MLTLERKERKDKGLRLFDHGYGGQNVEIYRGIMNLVSRFGYISVREVQYQFPELGTQEAINRLFYLESNAGLLRRFESWTVPSYFYSLTPEGREEIQRFGISEEVTPFVPSQDYKLIYQHHSRGLIKAYIAIKKIFPSDFLGWVSERQLKTENAGKGKRVMDGEFFLRAYRQPVKKDDVTHEFYDSGAMVQEQWRCGLELELSIKSPLRYHKQFRSLAEYQGRFQIILFLYSGISIKERLQEHSKNYMRNDCIFYFAPVEEFFKGLGDTDVERVTKSGQKIVKASEMNSVKVLA